MKLQNLCLLAIMAFTFFNCSSDDDNGGNTDNAVVGTWRLTEALTGNAFDLNNDGTVSNDLMAETNCLQNETMVFAADGTGAQNTTSYLDIVYDIVIGTTDTFEYTVDCVSEMESFPKTWTQAGNTISVAEDGFVLTGTISGNEMTFEIMDGFEYEDLQSGATVFVEDDLTFVFVKQ